jgi:hypothetical protein
MPTVFMSSSRVDKHFHRISPDLLKKMAEQANETPIRWLFNHDVTIPPWGSPDEQ